MQTRGDYIALACSQDEPEINDLAFYAHKNEEARGSHGADIVFGLAFTWGDPHWDTPGFRSTSTDLA